MKKKIALLLAAVMTVGSLPMTAFASTENTVSSIKTVEDGDAIEAKVFLDEFKGIGATEKTQTVRLTLTNAKFTDANYSTSGSTSVSAEEAYKNAVAALPQSDQTTINNQKKTLDNAKAALDKALGVDGTELKADMESKKAILDGYQADLTKLIGTESSTEANKYTGGTISKNLAAAKDYMGTRDGIISGTDGTGSLATALTAAIAGDLSTITGKVYFSDGVNTSNVDLTKIKDASTLKTAVYGSNTIEDDYITSGVTAPTNMVSTDTTNDTNLRAASTINSGADGFKFWADASVVLTEEQQKAIDDLNALYTQFVNADSLLVSTAKQLKTEYTDANDLSKASTGKIAVAQADYTAAKNAYDVIAVNVQNAQDAFDSAESTFLTTIGKFPAVYQAYQNLKNGGSTGSTSTISGDVKYTKISDTEYMAEFDAKDGDKVALEIFAEADGSGDASVTIESVDSVVSSQTLKIANIADGATTTTISGTTSIKEKGSKIKNVVITETTAGSIEAGTMKLRLTNGFTFTQTPSVDDIVVFPANGGNDLKVTSVTRDNDNQDLLITFTGSSTTAATISVGNLYVGYDEDDVEVGDECEITVSDAGTTKQSIVVGKASDYTVSFTAEDKDLPTFYAGTYNEDTDSLVVTLKEELEDAWITGRSTKIVFPEGVEVVEVNVEDKGNTDAQDATNSSASNISIDENEVDLGSVEVNNGKKAELELSFTLSISPEFTGDIEATLTGSGIGDDQTVVVGTAAAPVKVEADINELPIDYRKTEASDIVITEAAAGVLKKDTTVRLAIDGIAFDGDPTVEVESGDLKIENVKVKDEYLTFDVKTESQKEAAVIRISDVNLNMNRSLPAGDYDLLFTTDGDETNGEVTSESKLSKNAIIRNYNNDSKVEQGTFDVDEITALKGYVTVVTAGRDQDDSTFTTKVSVTIGASTMKAGTKDITLDVPAYISNGYTMMPVRAVTEALSGSAIVRWDDPTNTVTITFGQRVISMTVGSNVMKINGVDVAMQAQCEITDSRAFIPLRDLGYALGLNDSKIAWDDATKTATLN